MISRADLEERVREWGLRHNVVEKDYVLGWLLWGIGTDQSLGATWAFKGGTCLKKCYIETYRFSEDLDFTVLPGGPITNLDLLPILTGILSRVNEASGINFSQRAPVLKTHPSGNYTEGRVYYTGPLASPQVASVKLDISASEQVVRATVLQKIVHAYPDQLPGTGMVRCYSFEEVFAEKIRAMGERGRPRDLYDIINLFRRRDLRQAPEIIRQALIEKCQTKGVEIPTFSAIESGSIYAELEAEWENMLAHQLPALPPLVDFWNELPRLFAWLDGTMVPESALEPMPTVAEGADAEEIVAETGQPWRPVPTARVWGTGVPLEVVRFAAVNHLLVNLEYQGSTRLIEPYCLRRTRAGALLLHAVKSATGESRTYRVDRITSVQASTRTFVPRYQIEFNSIGQLVAPPLSARTATTRTVPSARPTIYRTVPYAPQGRHLVQCLYCQKKFKRDTPDTLINPHKNGSGTFCMGSGTYGRLLR